MKFRIYKNPYDERVMFRKGTIEIEEGAIYCFVGCNGSGKTTVMNRIKDLLVNDGAYEIEGEYGDFREAFMPDKKYNNNVVISFEKDTEQHHDWFSMMMSKADIAYSSTGEGIVKRLGNSLALLGEYVRDEKNKGKNLWVFFDDCDAGTSIDMIQDIKDVFDLIYNDCKKNNIKCTMILSANSFEMCHDLRCIDMYDFSEKKFYNYEAFKKFVLKSRERKERQYKKHGNKE